MQSARAVGAQACNERGNQHSIRLQSTCNQREQAAHQGVERRSARTRRGGAIDRKLQQEEIDRRCVVAAACSARQVAEVGGEAVHKSVSRAASASEGDS